MAATGHLVELFRSLQGEGAWIGAPQLFLRLAGCTLGCPWCDTRHSWRPGPTWRGLDGGEYANPETAPGLAARLAGWGVAADTTVSITGGEPLEQAPFLGELLPLLHGRGLKFHLETAAVDAGALASLLPWLDHVSMDWKTPATLGRDDLTGLHGACLDLLCEEPQSVAVKILVSGDTPEAEVAAALGAVHDRVPRATCILQPLTREGAVDRQALDRGLSLLWSLVGSYPGLRLLPQLHPLLELK